MTRNQLNDATMWVLGAFIATLPLFLGGNRPLVWIGAFTAACLLLAIYLALIFYINQELAFPLKRARLYAVVYGVFIGYQFIQILPGFMVYSSNIEGSSWSCCTLSVAPRETVLALMRWITFGIVAFLSLQLCANRKRSERFLTLLFWIAAFHAIIGFILFFMLGDVALLGQKWTYEGSMTGAFINRNTFATLLAAGLVLGVAQLFGPLRAQTAVSVSSNGGKVVKLALIVAALMVLVVDIASTNSRMGLVVALAGLITFIALTAWRSRRSNSRSDEDDRQFERGLPRHLALGATAVLLAVLLYLSPQVLDRVFLAEHSIADRSALYAQTWDMIKARPLTGFGGGSFPIAFPLFHQLPVNTDYIWDKAHNSYLALWSEYGLLLGSLPIVLIAMLFAALLTSGRREPALVVAAAVVVLSAVHALVDFSLEIEGYTVFFIAVTACGLARCLAPERQTTGAAP